MLPSWYRSLRVGLSLEPGLRDLPKAVLRLMGAERRRAPSEGECGDRLGGQGRRVRGRGRGSRQGERGRESRVMEEAWERQGSGEMEKDRETHTGKEQRGREGRKEGTGRDLGEGVD